MWSALGMGALERLVTNTSDRIGTGASLRHLQQREEVQQRADLNRADIMSRVEAAKAAGLHPLAGMGMSIAGSSGWQISGPLNSGAYAQPSGNRRIDDANARLAEANAGIAELELSQRRLATQPGNGPLLKGDVQIVPDQVTASRSGRPDLAAGVRPSNAEALVRLPDGSFAKQTLFGTQQEDEISQYVNLISRNLGISPATVERLASLGILGLSLWPAGKLANSAYKAYRATRVVKPHAPFKPKK